MIRTSPIARGSHQELGIHGPPPWFVPAVRRLSCLATYVELVWRFENHQASAMIFSVAKCWIFFCRCTSDLRFLQHFNTSRPWSIAYVFDQTSNSGICSKPCKNKREFAKDAKHWLPAILKNHNKLVALGFWLLRHGSCGLGKTATFYWPP